MGSYSDALTGGKFSPAQQDDIEKKLREWYETKNGIYIVPNIQREVFLPVARMESLLQTILDNKDADQSEFEEKYQQECYRHVIQGGAIRLFPLPDVLGRAVSTFDFINKLQDIDDDLFSDPDMAADFVVRLIAGDALSVQENDTLMSLYSVWVTWNEDDPTTDPFDFAFTNEANEIRANLGLEKKAGDYNPLLLLRYNRDISLALFNPTIADANTYIYFQTAGSLSELHGWTKPWPDILPGFNIKPRPEAIHEPEKLGLLLLPVEERQ